MQDLTPFPDPVPAERSALGEGALLLDCSTIALELCGKPFDLHVPTL